MNRTSRALLGAFALIVLATPVTPLPIARGQSPLTALPQPTIGAAAPAGQAAAIPQPVRIVHPQVSQANLARTYRVIPTFSSPAARAAELRIHAALDAEVDVREWQFVERPLSEVVDKIRDAMQVAVDIDTKTLEDAGIDPVELITFRSQGGTVRSSLRRLLQPVDLTWIVRDECLMLTTREQAQEALTTRLYPPPFGYGSNPLTVGLDPLIAVIRSAIDPPTWDIEGGPGSIRPLDDPELLIVTQTEEVHGQIASLMRELHARGLADFGVAEGDPEVRAPVVRIHPVADSQVRGDLTAKLVNLCNESLVTGADPDAKVTAVGECLAVQSVSPEFHVLAGRVIQSVAGVEVSPTAPARVGVAVIDSGR